MGWGTVKVRVRGPLRAGVADLVGGGGGLSLGAIPEDAVGVAAPMYFRVFFSSVDGAVGYLAISGVQS